MWLLRAGDDPVAQDKLDAFLDNKVNAKHVLKNLIQHNSEQKNELAMANEKIQQQEVIIADLKYRPCGPGFEEALDSYSLNLNNLEKQFTDDQIRSVVDVAINNIIDNIVDLNN